MTLKGSVTVTIGAAVSVDPVTATLPVAPGSVHSGAPGLAGGVVGHGLALTGAADDEVLDGLAGLDDAVPAVDPHAVSVATDAANTDRAISEDRREVTAVTLQAGRGDAWSG